MKAVRILCVLAGIWACRPPPGTVATASFQEGVDGYAGTKSVGISTYGGLGEPGSWNANGSTFADGDNDWCTGIDIPGGTAYSEVWLVRFDALELPAGASVTSAELTVHAYGNDTNPGVFLSGQYLAAPWNGDVPATCAGCSAAPVGWRYRDGAASPWASLGAQGDGADVIAGKTFRIPDTGFFSTGHTPAPYTATLDPAIVQTWLTGANHGLRIVTGISGVHVGYVQPQRNASARPTSLRPRLTVTYTY